MVQVCLLHGVQPRVVRCPACSIHNMLKFHHELAAGNFCPDPMVSERGQAGRPSLPSPEAVHTRHMQNSCAWERDLDRV